ncbi:MAG: hypothetical protein K9L68_10670 [Spirochaetales bacterium]|nr:hypothetical protein [Spirochaetales bacterium]MCF7939047.1 hypothetical protein [Spirochaetales bacterium]
MKQQTPLNIRNTTARPVRILLGILFLLAATALPLAAFPPTFVLGGTAENIWSPETTSTLWIDLYGSGSGRTALDNGYVALSGSATASYSPAAFETGSGSFQDKEQLEGTLGLKSPGGLTVLQAGITSSIHNLLYGTVLEPEWSLRYSFQEGLPVAPYIRYDGYYLYQSDPAAGTEDRLSNSLAAGFEYDPSIRMGYRMEAGGRLELWQDEQLLDSAGNETGEHRRDIIGFTEVEVTGLAGYFADWSVLLDGGMIFSNDNRYLSDTGELEEKSADAAFGGIEGSISWGPTRELQLESLLYADFRRFLSRKARNTDGSLASEKLMKVDTGGSIQVDWTNDDIVYYILQVSGGRTFSNDPAYDSWHLGISGGVEFGF